MRMLAIGQLHFVAALVALASGAWVLMRPKGGRAHRVPGWVYAGSMLLLNGTALVIYRLTGAFGPFHVAALVSLATLVAGVVPARRRLPATAWLDRHYSFMSWSYVGLCAAAVSETATRFTALRAIARDAGLHAAGFWLIVAAATLVVVAVGSLLIRRNAASVLHRARTSA